jgi:UDP-N-acetylmuramoyl-tripeptide--D-alanyl-D-alanine ligase
MRAPLARTRARLAARVLRRSRPLLRVLAFIWRRLLRRTTFIAVTGSVGKTTTKECLGAILAAHFPATRSRANQNGGSRFYLNVLRVRPWHRFAVLEIASAASGTMAPAARVVRPDIAVVLDVLRTHTTAFRTLDDHAAEKAVLLDALRPGGLAVLNGDDPRVAAMARERGCRARIFGTSPGADVRAERVSASWPLRLTFIAHTTRGSCGVETQLVGAHWVPSVLAAVAVAEECGVALPDIASALRHVEPTPARLSPVQLPGGAVVLRDDYNGSIDTLEPALAVLREASAGRRILVISDFSDVEWNRVHRLRHLGREAARAADVAVFIGENAAYGRRRAIEAGLPAPAVHAFAGLQEAALFLRSALRPGDLVLLKGRTLDHATRLLFAQLGEVACWKLRCPKQTLCDDCGELVAPAVPLRA